MEKVVYGLWRNSKLEREAFNQALLQTIGPALAEIARSVRINIQDEAVAVGNSPRFIATRPQMDAVIQLWVASAHREKDAIEARLNEICERIAGWLVAESEVIPNEAHPSPVNGTRTFGFSQIVFLGQPGGLTYEGWRQIWQHSHSQIAIDTQANFEYVQNLVVRPLTYGAPPYVAMVEECFPPEALHDPAAFYAAGGDPAVLAENERIMLESCARFIDNEKIDCIPTSQFDLKTYR